MIEFIHPKVKIECKRTQRRLALVKIEVENSLLELRLTPTYSELVALRAELDRVITEIEEVT